MNEQRRSFWPLPTAVLIGLVLYVASSGPACWLFHTDLLPNSMNVALVVLYAPLIWVADSSASPEWLKDLIDQYFQFWMDLA